MQKGVVLLSEKHKQIVNKTIRQEKVKVLLFPVALFALVYGVWISIFPNILNHHSVYNLISNILPPYQIGGIFIFLATVILVSYWLNQRKLLFASTLILLALWSAFTISFLLSSPPNTIWLLSATWTYFSFELVRRV